MGDLFSGGVPPEPPPVEDRFKLTELDAFLAEDDEEYDWLVEGVLERGDRLIVTGEEGAGKSTMLRQWGVQLASAVNPWAETTLAGPLRVTYVDLENGEKLIKRKLRHVRSVAGARYGGCMTTLSYPQGLDLESADAEDLRKTLREYEPDVVVIGPLYKMTTGNPSEETVAKVVARWFDEVRAEVNCALLIEAHSAKRSGATAKRSIDPFGASLWLRWPEFGFHVGEDGAITHWRGQRDERDWPVQYERDGEWMWNPLTDRDALEWAQVRAYLTEYPDAKQRAIAAAFGMSQSGVSRLKKKYEAEWAQAVAVGRLKAV